MVRTRHESFGIHNPPSQTNTASWGSRETWLSRGTESLRLGEPLIRKWFSLTADQLGEAKWQNLRHIQQVTNWVRRVNWVREVIKAGPSALVTDNAPNPRIRPRVTGFLLSHLFTGYVYRCVPNRIHYSPVRQPGFHCPDRSQASELGAPGCGS